MKRNDFLTLFIYIIYLCLSLELTARFLISFNPTFKRITKERGYLSETTRRIRWVKAHQNSKHSELIYYPKYKFDIYNPSRGWALKPNIKDMNVWDNKILNSNSKGIRGVDEYNYNKPADKIRILILGDSYTFGEEVSDNETYSYFLQQILPSTEVINLGVHGYGHDQMLIYMKKEGIKYHPDIVILGFKYENIYRNLLAFRDYAKPKFELANNKLKLKHVVVPAPGMVLKKEFYKSKFIDLLSILYDNFKWKSGLTKKRAEKITTAILDEMVKTINEIDAIPVFVYLPAINEITSVDEKITEGEKYLLEYCEDRGIYCISVHHDFIINAKKGINFKAWTHLNATAHHLIAQVIKRDLFIKKILPPSEL